MATWVYGFDANENHTSIQEPEGNVTRYDYDARDLLSGRTGGFGSPDAATDSYFYDNNRNQRENKDANLRSTLFIYDGFDRLKETIEPVGSQKLYTYDPSSNVLTVLERGTTGGPSPTNNSTALNLNLATTEFTYDERSRPYRIDRSAPSPQPALMDGPLTPGDGKVTNRIEHDRLNRRTFVVQDDRRIYVRRYDGLDRVTRTIDPIGNEGQVCYDDNSNPVKVIEIDKYPNGTTRSFETYDIYDALDRRVSTTDNLGQTRRYSYDSRDNVVGMSDASASLSAITINGRAVNNPGNTRRYEHDGFDRLVKETIDLRVGGMGGGAIDTSNPDNPDGRVIRSQEWDKNSRLRRQIDDRQKVTEYEYDSLNRRTREIFADLTFSTYSFDGADNLDGVTDARANQVVLAYDGSNRLRDVTCVMPGSSEVIGTRQIEFEYDGLNRRTKSVDSQDMVIGNSDDWTVARTFDALSRVTTENQNGRTVTSTWVEEWKRTALTYPTGVVVSYLHDPLDRIGEILASGNMLARYSYAGPGKRILTRECVNGVTERHQDIAGSDSGYYDGVRRPTRIDYVNQIGELLTGFEHAFDREDNRRYERRLHAPDLSKGDNYVYDSLYRLTSFERGVPSGNVGSPGGGVQQVKKDWRLDGVQNWTQLVTNGTPTSNTANDVNEYTAFGIATPQYDADGNMTSPDSLAVPSITLSYDFLNRLARIHSGAGVVSYAYDAESRRARTTTSGVAGAPAYSEHVYDGWQVIEDHATPGPSSAVMRRYIIGVQLDEPLRLENLAFPSVYSGTYYYQTSTLGHVIALTDAVGSVVERYTYDAYGSPQYETAASNAKSVSQSEYGNASMFCGRTYDPHIVGLYDIRTRVQSPLLGRFSQRDWVGVWGDLGNLGNTYGYVGNRPTHLTDPYGLYPGLRAAAAIGSHTRKAAAAAKRQTYKCPKAAARAAGQAWHYYSTVTDIEVKSWILQRAKDQYYLDEWAFGGAGTGKVAGRLLPFYPAGDWHSHGGPSATSEEVSEGDKQVARDNGCNAFVSTPGGKLLEWDRMTEKPLPPEALFGSGVGDCKKK